MSTGSDGLTLDEQGVELAAGRLPIQRGRAAATSAARLPSGQLFGVSPAATSLAEVWTLAADHHKTVTAQLREDLVALRDALRSVLANTAESEADAAARYARAAEQYATEAEQRSSDLMASTDEFIEANASEVADELGSGQGAETLLVPPGESGGGQGADRGPGGAGAGESDQSPYGPSGSGADESRPSTGGPSGAGADRPGPPTGGNGPYG